MSAKILNGLRSVLRLLRLGQVSEAPEPLARPRESSDDCRLLPALVIVDMQTYFLEEDDGWLIDSVVEVAGTAKSKGWPIFLLELYHDPALYPELNGTDYGVTHPQLMRHLTGYDRLHRLGKAVRDGSPQILAADSGEIDGVRQYLVCGAYSDQCVAATADGLARARTDARVEVVTAACKAYEATFRWSQFPRQDNIRLQLAAA